MNRRSGASALLPALVAFMFAAVVPGPAHGYDPATTHAGLTERAVVASGLHKILARRLSRPLGVFEPVALRLGDVPAPHGAWLQARLDALDPGAGCRPTPDGVASALAWIVAGSVIAGTPAERGQHFYYDPSRGSGLSEAGGLTGFGYGLRLLLDSGGGGFRGFAAGSSFNMTGRPSTEWLLAAENDVGLPAFHDHLEAAVAGSDPGQRASALARALLALGGTLAVVEDAGDPAHVRNDFRAAYLGKGGASVFDRGSAFERFVSETYGRMGLPAPPVVTMRPNVLAFITAADGQGLADRTQRRFFSDGSVPEDAIVDRDTNTVEVMQDARASLPYAYPKLPRLELRAIGKRQYAVASDTTAVAGGRPRPRRLLAYERVPGRVRFFLDEAVYADSARVLLPEIAGYAAGLVNHLFRGEIQLVADAAGVAVSLTGTQGQARGGAIRIYAEAADGKRREIGTAPAGPDETKLAVPVGTRRIAAVWRGQDDAGALVAVAETLVR